MSVFILASSCIINAERRSGRVLLHESNIVLMFHHASLSLFPHFTAYAMRRFSLVCFYRIWKISVDCGEPAGTYADKFVYIYIYIYIYIYMCVCVCVCVESLCLGLYIYAFI